jgi:hypothetical protein
MGIMNSEITIVLVPAVVIHQQFAELCQWVRQNGGDRYNSNWGRWFGPYDHEPGQIPLWFTQNGPAVAVALKWS